MTAPALTLGGGTLPPATAGARYSATVTASGGSGSDLFTATGLPAGLTMGAGGTVSGAPTVNRTARYTVTVTVTDTAGQKATASYSLTVTAKVTSSPSPSPSPTIVIQ